ncbi:nephronectin a isoform X2 [Narcine bancroftii]|uniref:nephronectin a isoform X2 n=1 Tax=Narcine bancroftii TaxID=1343680 RepID=UPI003831CC2E
MRGFVGHLLAVSTLYLCATAEESSSHRVRKQRSLMGMCRYGFRMDCCWGWNRRPWGQCQPVCQHRCKHGECVGPNKCKCYPGYTGKTCNQDFNECGMKPRPCKHRCMNTYGSYKCYCLNGYMLMSDGSCANMRSCAMANCQYGCDEAKGEIHCRCPSPGLQLAPDGRTCIDVDECSSGRIVCPRFRKCINTFGSYFCKCHEGFDLRYYNGKYRCLDIDECARRTHKCSAFATCYNIPGFYKCKCITGYKGNGYSCTADKKYPLFTVPPRGINNETVNVVSITTEINRRKPTTMTPPFISKNPEVKTENPILTTNPTTTRTTIGTTTTNLIASTTLATDVDNRIPNEVPPQRGDVFIPREPGALLDVDDIEEGITAEENGAGDDQDILVNSCNFDHGMCGWMQDKNAGLHWERVPEQSGRGWYLSLPVSNHKQREAAHLLFALGRMTRAGNLCLTFRHKLSGDSAGKIQVFVKRSGMYGHVLWERNRAHGWRTSRFTLRGPGLESVIFKGIQEEKRGVIGLDDISMQKGHCSGKIWGQK